MSWYNNQNQGFIDATQELQSGTSQTIINEIGEISDVFIPKQLNTENESLDTIIVNNTPNSRIFFKNQNTTPKVKIEDGKLYLYYTYDFTNAPTITTGWIDVDNYITAIKQSVLLLDANSVAIDTLLLAPVTGLKPRFEIVEPLTISTATQVTQHEARITSLEEDYLNSFDEEEFFAYHRELATKLDQELKNFRDVVSQYSDQMSQLIQTSANYTNQSRVFQVARLLYNSKNALFTGYLQNILFGLGGVGVIIGVVSQIYDIITSRDKETQQLKLLTLYEKIKNEPLANELKFIHLNGLTIIESTNDNFSTSGSYTITLPNQGKLSIQVKVVNSALKAFILKVKEEGGYFYNVNDIINIPKSSLGGTTGNLQIQVTSLISEVQIISNLINELNQDLNLTQNRRRLRDGIINKNEFGDGLTIVYNNTETNAETGEVLQVPTIKLNLNSTQLETISGVLNIKKYINSDDLAKIYEILLPSGATITSDYKLNLGYKEIFSGYPYDLIMMAIKSDTYTTFSATNYNNDYLGYFPNMSRLALGGDAKVINTTTLTANSSQHFTKGLIYIKNTNELKVFNLNRKFEFVSFLKFSSFINSTASYHIIQNGVDLGGQIELDNTKLSVYIKNRKLRIKQPALVSYGVYTTGSLNSITTRLLGAIEYFILEPITISGVPYNDNIRITSTPMGAGYDDYKYELKMLNVPYRLNNESEFINTPTGFIRIVNANDSTQPAFDTRFIAMYLNHPSVPSTPIANCIYPTILYKVGIKNNGDVFLDPDWNIQRIILRFDILFHRTQDINYEGAPDYYPFPVLYHENTQSTDYNTDFTFRLRYSVDGVNYITHNFTMNNVTGSAWENNPTSTGTTIRTGWYSNMSMPKRYWTYTYTIPNTYPIYGQKVRFVDFTLVKKPNWNYLFATTAENPYMKQPVLHLYEFKLEEYTTTPTQQVQVIANNYETIDANPAFVAGISNSAWYLFNLQLDLPNNSINYYLNNTLYNFTERNTIDLYPADTTMPDPAVPFVTATFVSWTNLTQDNSLLVIGNSPSIGEVHFTHFNWRYFQTTEQFLTLTQVQKLTELIAYNYYYDYVSVDKLLDTNEISANRILTKQLVVNNNSLINGFTSATRSRDLRSDQTQEAGNVLIKTTNLYVENPPSYNGNLYYNYLTKTFTIRSVSGRSDEDDNIRTIIQASAGTGLQWNATNNTLNVIPESLWQDLTPIYTLIGTNDQNVSNYVWETSNYLKGVIDNIPPPTPYDDTAVYTQITTTSNILNADFVARDGVLNTSIDANKYTDAKVASYLSNNNNKLFNGYVGIGTTDPLSQLEIKGQYATLRIVDSDLGTGTTGIELIRGTGVYGSDGITDWRIENAQGLFRITKKVLNGFPDFLSIFTIFPTGLIGILNDAPIAPLTIGNSATDNSDGFLVISKRTTGGASRHFRLGLNSSFDFTIGDFGNNNTAGTWLEPFKIAYDTPSNAFRISNGITTANSDFKISNTYKLQFEAGTPANPATISGGTGAKIIYYPSTTTYPYATGIGASALWNSIPTGATYRQYINGVEHLRTLVNQTIVSSTGENVNCILGLATPYTGTGKYGCAIIAEAYTSYSRANMCFCVNNSTDNFNSASLSNVRMKIWYFSYTEFYGTSTSGSLAFTFMSANYSYNIIATTAHSVCIKANGAIWATGVIATSSSREIKKDIEELDDQECLNKLLQLKPCKYRYIDSTRNLHPTKKVFGFIAEEVKEVLPEAVDDTLKELIPNIYTKGDAEGDILTISKALEVGVEYTCYGDDSNDAILITPLEDLGDGDYRINKTYDTKKKLLVYGKTIENFHALKKEYFHALCVSSIQEHHKIIMKQKEEITDLKERLAKLETIVMGMLSGGI